MRVALIGAGLLLVATMLSSLSPLSAAVNPNLFVDEFVGSMPSQAVAGEWMPNGELLLLQRNGGVRTVNRNTGASTPIFTVPNVSTAGERGALDLALHPNFAANNQFFVYHATNAEPARLRITRFTLSGGSTAGTAQLIWQNPGPAHVNQFHIGGSLEVSNDNKLLLSIGDGLIQSQSQQLNNVFGKVIRINLDGSIPANPFADGAGPNLEEIYAYGLRNPFRAWVDPQTGDYWVGDVGGNTATTAYEEVNKVVAGGNYGWPLCQGPLGPPKNGPNCPGGISAPFYSYDHDFGGGCCQNRSITGGQRYQGNQMPSEMNGAYIFGDWAENKMWWASVQPNGSVGTVSEIPLAASNLGPVWISVGPDGQIYYLRYDYTSGAYQLRRVRYTGSVDNPPVINSVSATPTDGPAPLNVSFSSNVTDPDGDPITYAWTFGDGGTSNQANPSHSYASVGSYTAQLVATANGVSVASDTIDVMVGSPPTVSIDSPLDGSMFIAGQDLPLSATGNDPDGTLSASDYDWTVDLIHDNHQHSYWTAIPGNGLVFPVETTGHDFRGSTGFHITVTVTDADGLTATDSIDVFPTKVDLTFTNSMGGGTVSIDSEVQLAPFVLDTAIGFEHTLEAPTEICVGNTTGTYASWSDGGARIHTITVPGADQTYSATYSEGGQCVPCYDTWEAELGVTVTSGFVTAGDPAASANQFVWVPDGTLGNMLDPPDATTPVLEYCLNVTQDADYYLEGVIATATTNDTANSFWVQIDNGPWQAWHTPDSTAWVVDEAAAKTGPRFEWALTAGVHTLRIGFREDGAKLDTVSLRTDASPPDSTPPNTTIDDPGVVAPGTMTVTGTASDTGSGVSLVRVRTQRLSDGLFWNGSAWVASSNTWPLASGTGSWSAAVPVTDGSYRVWAYSVDGAGNVETWAAGRPSITVLVGSPDSTPPDTSIDDPGVVAPGTMTVTGSASDAESGVALVRVRVQRLGDGLFWDEENWVGTANTWRRADGTTSWSFAVPVVPGTYTVWAYAVNGAGIVETWGAGRPSITFSVS